MLQTYILVLGNYESVSFPKQHFIVTATRSIQKQY